MSAWRGLATQPPSRCTRGNARQGRHLELEVATLRWAPDLVPAGTRRILFVDDVAASGATLEAAIGALPASHVLNVVALAIFRAV